MFLSNKVSGNRFSLYEIHPMVLLIHLMLQVHNNPFFFRLYVGQHLAKYKIFKFFKLCLVSMKPSYIYAKSGK